MRGRAGSLLLVSRGNGQATGVFGAYRFGAGVGGMNVDEDVFKERQAIALRSIKSLYDKPEGEYGPTLFVSHHLSEIESAYWLRTVGIEQPSPDQILNLLVLVNSWSSEGDENINTFDVGLPENASNYLLSVRFDGDGHVQDVAMES